MRRLRRAVAPVAALVLAAAALGGLSTPSAAADGPTTTLSFSAHQDDDLLFMNPDIASDIEAGFNVWVTYLSAGELPCESHDPCGMDYADLRVAGERAAYAEAARVPNQWTYEQMWFGGHPVAVNHLDGTNVHLAFTYIHAAAGPEDNCGDLYRMLKDGSYVANPIDGRPGYTKDSFVGMLDSIIDYVGPDYIRTQSTIGHREVRRDGVADNVDHVAGAILAADADVDGAGKTRIRRDEYQGYIITDKPDNVSGYWRDRKQAIWDQYKPHDPALWSGSWNEVMGKQYRPEGRIFWPGIPWVPPGDFTC
ncbi:PIG-L family deacetylase [Amycolatopsis sp. NBC_01286]|uniref:PIG-L family deacetylase n=1 Tax=Amycolatopsis sp. NBC_01286 TaxID=2903560 RepID=UPI002E0E9782|nr:PIG-L family deacetylase [Amycolatopsis sp. NBC_01286]